MFEIAIIMISIVDDAKEMSQEKENGTQNNARENSLAKSSLVANVVTLLQSVEKPNH